MLAAAADTAKAAVMTAFDYVMRNGGVEFTPPGPSSRRLQTTSSTASDAVRPGKSSCKHRSTRHCV